jgi:serine/threonine protein kinase
VVRSGGMGPTLVLRLAEQLLDALEMAHAHGIIHGALSPSNVIVTSRGGVRLVDFTTPPGLLARPADALLEARARVSPFVAPERRASERSDLWSVGACLHYAVAGVAPSSAPSVRRTAIDADAALVEVIERALATDPLERYESAYAMLADIRCVTSGNRPSLLPSCAALPSQGPSARLSRPVPSPPSPGLEQEPGTAAEILAPASRSLGLAPPHVVRARKVTTSRATASRSPSHASTWALRSKMRTVTSLASVPRCAASQCALDQGHTPSRRPWRTSVGQVMRPTRSRTRAPPR